MLSRNHPGVDHLSPFLLICWLACSIGFGADARDADRGDLARQIFVDTEVQGGLIVHVGCRHGKLTAALRFSERYVVQGLDVDRTNLERARSHIGSLDLYGPVSVAWFDGRRLPYADNLVNLVVSEDLGSVPMEEVMRVLAPRGVAYVKQGGSWKRIDNPWPNEIDEWTHWLHGSDGNPVARDTVVGPPRQMQWFAKPTWSRSHEKSPSLTGMVSSGGRLFYILDEGPASIGGPLPDRWRLVARDAFSGVLLWKRPVPDWGWRAWSPGEPMNLRWGNPRFIHRRLVAVEDRVYVTLGYGAPVAALDAATGKTIQTYRGTENTSEILYHQGILVLSMATEAKTATAHAPALKILAIVAATGQQIWKAGPFASLYDLGERGKSNVLKQGRLMVAAGGDRVYCVTQTDILALDLSDGKTAWTVPRPAAVLPAAKGQAAVKKVRLAASKMFTNLGSIMYQDGRVFCTQPHVPTNKLVNNVPMTLICLSAKTGVQQWRRICGDWSYTTNLNVYAARGLLWVHEDRQLGPYELLGLVPETGEVEVRYDLESVLATRHHHRCYRNKATENFLLMGKEGVEYVNLQNGAVQPHRWLRGMCLYGIMPANGLLYVPPQACSCNPMTMLQGYWALAPASSLPDVPAEEAGERLKKGPAYSAAIDRGVDSPGDWPMYRHDPLRSGATRSSVDAAKLRERWKTRIGGRLTGPVAAGGRVYLGRRDTHELLALDAVEGAVVWRYRMGGEMDTPPTVYQGLVLAGCWDGWVYCLRASDGELVWRFRAAPRERYVVAEDRVVSAWPVHGSVMIQDGIAYVTAGRSSFLDGGLRLYMLDPRTGKVLNEKTLYTEQTDQEAFYEGVTSDLLVSDSEGLFMRHLRIDPNTLELTRMSWWGFTGPEQKGKDRPYVERRGLPVTERRYTYLRSGQGFLDDSLYGRTQFHLEGGESCHLLCFDQQRSYGFQLSAGTGHFVFFTPGGEGYSILCFDREHEPARKQGKIWEEKLPLRVQAMVLAGENLFLGGVPDRIDPNDPLASFDGRAGASLAAIEAETGRKLSKLELDAAPVFDGLIAAAGRLYLTDRAGNVLCLTGAGFSNPGDGLR